MKVKIKPRVEIGAAFQASSAEKKAPVKKPARKASKSFTVKKGDDTYRVNPDGSMKNLTPGKATPKPNATGTASTTAAVPTDPNTQRATADAELQFGPKERKLIDAIGQGTAHQTTIDRVYDGYKQQLGQSQTAVKTATDAALAGMRQGAADSLAAAGASTDQTQAAAAQTQATTGADTGQQVTTDELVRKMLAGAQGKASIQQDAAQQQGLANEAALARLGLVGEGQKGIFKENTTAYVNQLGRDKMDLDSSKAASIIAGKREYDDADAQALQQQITNTLAAKSLASKDKATQLDYDLRLKKLDLDATKLATDDENKDADRTARVDIAEAGNLTQTEIARLGRTAAAKESSRQRAFQSKQNTRKRNTDLLIAGMKSSGKGKPSANGTWKLPSGATVMLSPAKQEQWRSRAALYDGALTEADKVFTRLAKEGHKDSEANFKRVAQELQRKFNLPSSVARAAARDAQLPGAPTGQYLSALKGYFPGGIIPGSGAKKVG